MLRVGFLNTCIVKGINKNLNSWLVFKCPEWKQRNCVHTQGHTLSRKCPSLSTVQNIKHLLKLFFWSLRQLCSSCHWESLCSFFWDSRWSVSHLFSRWVWPAFRWGWHGCLGLCRLLAAVWGWGWWSGRPGGARLNWFPPARGEGYHQCQGKRSGADPNRRRKAQPGSHTRTPRCSSCKCEREEEREANMLKEMPLVRLCNSVHITIQFLKMYY